MRSTLAFLFGISALVLKHPADAAYPPSAEGTVGVVTDHIEASRAALETMRQGGNAIDGAISAALTLGVVSPGASGLGGGGFAMVYWKATGKTTVVDFRETAPKGIKPDDMKGKRAMLVGVPGEPAGLEWLHQHYGARTLAQDAAPAVKLASEGFPVGKYLNEQITRWQKEFASDPAVLSTFYPNGQPLAYRERFVRAKLARTIETFGKSGSAPFYRGDIARSYVKTARAAGSPLAEEDLVGYQVKIREPLRHTFGTRTVVTMPAPSAGGLMLIEAMASVGPDAKSLGFGSSAYDDRLANVIRAATRDRWENAGDPDIDSTVVPAFEKLLTDEALAARAKSLTPRVVRDGETEEHGTSHLIVSDAQGNVVSLTTTINSMFGARLIDPETGIILNDELGDFTFGQADSHNRPRPGARPVSSMTPTIVFEKGAPVMSVGGSGGTRIATGVTQATLARLAFGMDPLAAVSSPRIFTSGKAPELMVDPEVPEDVRKGLTALGHVVKDDPMTTNAVQMLAWEKGHVLAAGDPRKSAFALAQ